MVFNLRSMKSLSTWCSLFVTKSDSSSVSSEASAASAPALLPSSDKPLLNLQCK